MASVGSNTATVTLVISVNAGQATRALQGVGNQAQTTAQQVGKSTSEFQRRITSQLQTIQKALLSMFGVLIAYNLLITLPEKILEGLGAAFVAGVKAVGEFEERVIAAQAILAQTQKWFPKDVQENYAYAGRIAESVIWQLVSRSKELRGTFEDAMLVFQTLINRGVGRYAKNMQEVVDLTILLSNAIAVLTTKQNQSLQAVQETSALMLQQNKAGSLLVKFLFNSTSEMERFFKQAEKSKDLVEKLTARLSELKRASEDLGRTMTGIKTSFESFFTVFAKLALGSTFERLRGFALDLLEQLQKDQAGAVKFASYIQGTIETLWNFLKGILGIPEKLGVFDSLTDVWMKLVYWAAYFFKWLQNIFAMARVILPLFFKWQTAIILFANTLAKAISTIAEFFRRLGKGIWDFGKAAVDPKKGLWVAFSELGAVFKDFAVNAIETGEQFWEDLGNAWEQGAAAIANLETLEETPKAFAEAIVGSVKKAAAIAGPEIAKILADRIRLSEVLLGAERRPFDVEGFLKPILSSIKVAEARGRAVRSQLDIMHLAQEGVFPKTDYIVQFKNLASNVRGLQEILATLTKYYSTFDQALKDAAVDFEANDEEMLKMIEGFEKLSAQISVTTEQISALQRAMYDLFNTKFADIFQAITTKVGAKFAESIMEALSKAMKKQQVASKVIITDETGAEVNIGSMEEKFKSIIDWSEIASAKIGEVWESFTKGLQEAAIPVLFAFGNMVADMVEGVVTGTKSIGEAFKTLAADMLTFIGKMAIQIGTVLLLIGLATMIFDPSGNGAKLAAIGAALIAIGTGMLALSAAVKGSQGGGSAGSAGAGGGGGGGERTIYLEPYPMNIYEKIVTSLEKLNTTLSSFDTKSPGVVVKEGAVAAKGALTVAVGAELKQNTSARANMGNTLFEQS